jgi:hypothetical protein
MSAVHRAPPSTGLLFFCSRRAAQIRWRRHTLLNRSSYSFLSFCLRRRRGKQSFDSFLRNAENIKRVGNCRPVPCAVQCCHTGALAINHSTSLRGCGTASARISMEESQKYTGSLQADADGRWMLCYLLIYGTLLHRAKSRTAFSDTHVAQEPSYTPGAHAAPLGAAARPPSD